MASPVSFCIGKISVPKFLWQKNPIIILKQSNNRNWYIIDSNSSSCNGFNFLILKKVRLGDRECGLRKEVKYNQNEFYEILKELIKILFIKQLTPNARENTEKEEQLLLVEL